MPYMNVYQIPPEVRAAYIQAVAQIDRLLAMPYGCRADYWWNEEFARAQKLRDSLVTPPTPPRNRMKATRRQRSAYFEDRRWSDRRDKMYGYKPLSAKDSHRFLVNWE